MRRWGSESETVFHHPWKQTFLKDAHRFLLFFMLITAFTIPLTVITAFMQRADVWQICLEVAGCSNTNTLALFCNVNLLGGLWAGILQWWRGNKTRKFIKCKEGKWLNKYLWEILRKTQHLSWTSAVRLLQEPKLIGKRVSDERMIAALLFSSVAWSRIHITLLFTPELPHNLRKTNTVGSKNKIIFILWPCLASNFPTVVNFQLCDAQVGWSSSHVCGSQYSLKNLRY